MYYNSVLPHFTIIPLLHFQYVCHIYLNQELFKVSPQALSLLSEPASVAQSDECPTGVQEVVGSILVRSGNIFLWRLIMKYFLWSFFSVP